MRVNLKVLSTFLAVAENESFRKAAEQTTMRWLREHADQAVGGTLGCGFAAAHHPQSGANP